MPNRVYCHIGLPKTATTSLQLDCFPYVDNKRYFYLGVRQPRGKYSNDPLYELILNAVYTGEGLEQANAALKERIREENKSIILSEEMLTVSSANIAWQEKLARLMRVLEGTDFRILVSVREPVSAMFSFYVELYQRFRSEEKSFLDLALSANDFMIYRYESLVQCLVDFFGESNIYFQRFEDILNGNVDGVMRFLDYPEMDEAYTIIGNHNKKSRNDNHILVPVRPRLVWVTRLYNLIGGEKNIVARVAKRLIKPLLDKVKAVNYRTIAVPVLEERERDVLKKELSASMGEISERFGVKY